jgi:hypothetical protein
MARAEEIHLVCHRGNVSSADYSTLERRDGDYKLKYHDTG